MNLQECGKWPLILRLRLCPSWVPALGFFVCLFVCMELTQLYDNVVGDEFPLSMAMEKSSALKSNALAEVIMAGAKVIHLTIVVGCDYRHKQGCLS